MQCFGQHEVFTVVDTQPQFPGGLGAFYEYVDEHLIYPESARASNIEGKVFIQFIVETTGEISEVKTIKGIDPVCDAEAEKVIKNAPNFIPGQKKQKPVRVRVILPITFSLKTGDKIKSPEPLLPLAKSVEEVLSDSSIIQLTLEFQDLTELGKEIGEASQLSYLNLTGNNLKELPKEIGALGDLKDLFLTKNLLSNLPASFSQLQSLRTLYIDRNEISIFSAELLMLQNLQTIDISYTNIKELPWQIAQMPKLKTIYARSTFISIDQINKIREINENIEILK